MRVAYIQSIGGASGDMLLAALVDLGFDLESLHRELSKLEITGYEITAEQQWRREVRGTKLSVVVQDQARYSPRGLLETVKNSGLSTETKAKAEQVLSTLWRAEARVHGEAEETLELEELGSVDTLVDVVGGIVGLDALGIERLYSSPFPSGSGVIKSEHGVLPVPGPATAALMAMANAPVVPAPGNAIETGEMVTPTGAAIITTLATFGQPAMNLERIGYGLGMRESRDYPNALALWIGEENGVSLSSNLTMVETNVDDMTGELLGYVQERLFDLGARDVWFSPIQMKKNRPATMLSAIVSAELEPQAIRLLMRETTTLGVRVRPLTRYEAEREETAADTQFGRVAVKVKRLDGTNVGVSADAPSSDSVYKLVQYDGRPVMKLSPRKQTLPGPKQVHRRRGPDGLFAGDLIARQGEKPERDTEPLLEQVMSEGRRLGREPALGELRERFAREFARLPSEYKARASPPRYTVDISPGLRNLESLLKEKLQRR